jgi:hypothetical protein
MSERKIFRTKFLEYPASYTLLLDSIRQNPASAAICSRDRVLSGRRRAEQTAGTQEHRTTFIQTVVLCVLALSPL